MPWIETAPKQWADGVRVVCGVDTEQDAEELWAAAQAAGATVSRGEYVAAIDAHTERVAQSAGYSGAVSLTSYVGSTVPKWKAEALAFVEWRDAVWSFAYKQLDLMQSGLRTAPTIEDLIKDLPVIEWPP